MARLTEQANDPADVDAFCAALAGRLEHRLGGPFGWTLTRSVDDAGTEQVAAKFTPLETTADPEHPQVPDSTHNA